MVGASIALATNLLPSMVSPFASRTAPARPFFTTISRTSASVITAPPCASSRRCRASGKLTAPPTGSVNSITLEKMNGNTMPAPGTLSVVITCM